jgi:heterokaryon incompatibility protein (HET)
MPYSYSRLDSARREIRLIRIHPGNDAADTIELTVYHTTLDEAGDYFALSYAWGSDRELKRSVILNGTVSTVTANLHSALWHIRLPEKKVIIWIDAICIDQTDIAEREGQVRQMRNIFGGALEVLAWIGPEVTREESEVFRFIEIMAEQMTPEKAKQLLNERQEHSHIMAWDSFVSMTPPGFSTSVWFSVIKLLERQWFSRVWVIQEVVMGVKISVLCGKHRLSWDVLFGMAKGIDLTAEFVTDICMFSYDIAMRRQCSASVYAEWVEQSPLTRLARALNYILAIGRSREKRLALERREASSGYAVNGHGELKNMERTPFDVVNEYQTFNSTLILDKVYALLGVAIVSDQVGEVVEVNYNLSILDLYWNIVELGLKNGGHLEFLNVCNGVPGLHEVPSWMPLWYPQGEKPIAMRRLALDNKLLFRASADMKPIYRFDRMAKTLYLKATFVSRIEQLGQESTPLESGCMLDTTLRFEDPAPYQWADMLRLNDLTTSRRQPPFRGKQLLESIKSGYPTKEEQLWIDFFRTLEMNYAGPFAETIDLFLKASLDKTERNSNARCFRLSQMLGRRRLFVAKQRNAFGLCPRDAEPGDEIAIIHGAKTPFVVRQVSKGGLYAVVGPAFVVQLMDGSFIEALQSTEQISNGGSATLWTWRGAQFSVRIPQGECGMVGFV